MDPDDELRDFDGTGRLFPLPNFVLFPNAVVPLHIFEPRYRQMTEDAIASNRLITIVQIRPDSIALAADDPPVEPVACLGRILEYERLPDGRFNFLLVGKRRVRIIDELPKTRLYRRARLELLDDLPTPASIDPLRPRLVQLFRKVIEMSPAPDTEMRGLLESSIPLGPLTDIISHAIGLPAAMKQTLLEEIRIDQRARGLIDILERVLDATAADAQDRGFPPPFSVN